ncbi:VTT domain-containing protein [Lutibacter sp.]|uniref:YqaA family protein n=1 Tax=Lutibacter sp. TaxID=1925666 RepID=UPI0025C0D0A1|nr:VTT domain-containing protein [Lutibacter sp.]MCF6181746.1 VTT domain-containing protein [Lutibacter sp.]
MSRIKNRKKSKIQLLHQYYNYTGFYKFLIDSAKKAIPPILFLVAVLWVFHNYVYNINDGLELITASFSRIAILFMFFLSETLLGLIPPEIFIAWSKKTTDPILNLALLATLSYLGGILSYFIGKAVLKIKIVKDYFENKMVKHLKNTTKWGGFLIAVGALLPIPFSITCLAAGMIKYPLKGVLIFGTLRFVRFAIYGAAIYNMVS